MSGNCSLIDPRYSLPFLLSGCSLASPSFFVLDARTSNVFTKECLEWLTNTCRGSLPLLNELNHYQFTLIMPRAQSCFAAPDYWRDLLVQSDTRHQPNLWNMTLLLPKKRFQSGFPVWDKGSVNSHLSVHKMSFWAKHLVVGQRTRKLFDFFFGDFLKEGVNLAGHI